jgi:hypothetical protein
MNIKEEEEQEGGQNQKQNVSSDVSSDTTRAENRGDILVSYFWDIYDQLEAQDDNDLNTIRSTKYIGY